jgi:PKHD-type hydroxylase
MLKRFLVLGKTVNDPQNYYWYQNAFSKEHLAKLEQQISTIPFEEAITFGGKSEIRRSKIKWLHQTPEFEWLYELITKLAIEANDAVWKFNITACLEAIQYTEYYADDLGHYEWHQDIGPSFDASRRKVSVTIQLSDSDAYDGGDLQIWKGGTEIQTCPRGAGVGVIFPSYMMHRVTDVTRGTRKSLVLWIGGEHYK